MEKVYEVESLVSKIRYGHSISTMLREIQPKIAGSHVLLIVNQHLYESYYDLFTDLLSKQMTLHWYICSNYEHCNQLNELENLLSYTEEEDLVQPLVVMGLGNQGIYHLAAYFCCQSIFECRFIFIPSHFPAFFTSLAGRSFIENKKNDRVLTEKNLAEYILFDGNLKKKKEIEEQRRDLFSFIQIGLTSDHTFLQSLYRQLPTEEKLSKTSFINLMTRSIELMQNNPQDIQLFGYPFFRGVCRLATSHGKYEYDKQLIGCLLQLIWSQHLQDFSFQIRNFINWCQELGFNLELRDPSLLLTDFATEIMKMNKYFPQVSTLNSVGELGLPVTLETNSLMTTLETYQKWTTERE